ncbi:MAG: 23S rRNA (pseudouridine(1915)-N(3))-methyltransferase RlmH [Pseudomonadota bacterium]
MHIRVLAVGARQPDWVNEAVGIYAERLPRAWQFRIDELDAGKGAAASRERQGERLLAAIKRAERLIALREDGKTLRSVEFAKRLSTWQGGGDDIVFVIGGADGLSDSVRRVEDLGLSLSAMTLPHGLARVCLVEQLYRAHTLLAGHPYHRA